MWHLVLFVLKWLFVGKPKVKQYYFVLNEHSFLDLDKKIKEVLNTKKWEIVDVKRVDVTERPDNLRKHRIILTIRQKYY